MAIRTQQINPSTIKVSYNTSTKKVRIAENCPNCDPICQKGYESEGTVCGNAIPSSLCATISGMKRCSDNSTIATQSVCLNFACNFGGCIGWSNTIVIDGNTVTVLYKTGINCAFDTDGYIYDASDTWFVGHESGDPCVGVDNDIVIGDCGNNDFVYDCDATRLERNVVAYGGMISICNPNNAENW